MATTTFSLSTEQITKLDSAVDHARQGARGPAVLGAHITIHHAPHPVDPPTWVGHIVYNPSDGGPLLGAEFAL